MTPKTAVQTPQERALKSLEDVDTTAGLQKKNIYFSLGLYHTVLYQTIHIEHQHPLGGAAAYIKFLPFHGFWTPLKWIPPHLPPSISPSSMTFCFILRLRVTVPPRQRCKEIFTFTPAARLANRSWLQVVFVSNESTLIRARPQCKLPRCFTDVAC